MSGTGQRCSSRNLPRSPKSPCWGHKDTKIQQKSKISRTTKSNNFENLNHSFSISDELINGYLVQKNESFEIPSLEHQAYQPVDPNTLTPFQPAWKQYIGTYKYIKSGWKLSTPAKIALVLGITTSYTHIKVYEKD